MSGMVSGFCLQGGILAVNYSNMVLFSKLGSSGFCFIPEFTSFHINPFPYAGRRENKPFNLKINKKKMILSVHRNTDGRLQHIHMVWMWEWEWAFRGLCAHTGVDEEAQQQNYNHLSSFFIKHTVVTCRLCLRGKGRTRWAFRRSL